jgi:glycerol kinase
MILTIDEGTTSTRALMISESGTILGTVQKEFKQIFPQAAWVEHDPEEIWQATLEMARGLVSELLRQNKISKQDIKGIAITNQRESTVIWDKNTGKPVYNAIVWQCRRTSEFCRKLKDPKLYPGFKELVENRTGLLIDSYFSGPKIHWILENLANKQTDNLLFGTIDTWLLWKLTKGRSHATDASNASRTLIYDIHKTAWDQDLLKALGIPENILPKVLASNSSFGSTDVFKDLIGRELEIKAILGDQQAAFYAYTGKNGQAQPKITYGTGTFVLIPAGMRRVNLSQNHSGQVASNDMSDFMISPAAGLLTSIAYTKMDKHRSSALQEKAYAIEGSIFVGGAIVQWLRDGLKIINNSSEIEALAKTVTDNNGVYLIPALAGLGAPFWREDIRGSIFGITRGTERGHIARAALESIAFRVKDIFTALEASQGMPVPNAYINVDGGASKNNLLMQFQADLLQIPIKRYSETEMTALGVAKMTGEIDFELKVDTVFEPQKALEHRYAEWSKYLNLLRTCLESPIRSLRSPSACSFTPE